jgi:hypothetical protein
MQVAILLGLGLLPFVALVAAWRAWGVKSQAPNGARRRLFTLGLLVTSAALLIYLAFTIESARLNGWLHNLTGFTIWLRFGFWTSVAGFVFSCFGKGSGRAWSIASAVLLAGLWLVVAWAPA